MCSEYQGTIKELAELQFDDLRSTDKELLELGLELGSLHKKRVFAGFFKGPSPLLRTILLDFLRLVYFQCCAHNFEIRLFLQL